MAIKVADFKQTWEDVGGLSFDDKKQWIEENIDDLPSLINWVIGYSGLHWEGDTINVRELPACRFCGKVAGYRGKIHNNNVWYDMCEGCFAIQGQGVGPGIGYKLKLVKL